jgi:hypothetical protein
MRPAAARVVPERKERRVQFMDGLRKRGGKKCAGSVYGGIAAAGMRVPTW